MIFKDAAFYKYEKVDEDALGNPVYDDVEIGTHPTLITQWTSEEVALLDRDVTQNQRKLLTHAPKEVLNSTSMVEVDGITYTNILLKSDFVRWRLCHVKEYKR